MSTPIDEMLDSLSPEPEGADATPLDATPEDATAPVVEGEKTAASEQDSPTPEQVERARDAITGRFVPQAPAAMPDPVKAAEQNEQRVIPLAAHLEERRRLQAELRTMEERLAALEKPPAPPAPEPDFLEDPKGYVDAKTQKALDALQKVEQQAEVLTKEQQVQQFLGQVGAVEAEYVKQAPDYYDALAHIRTARAEQLAWLFPQAEPHQIQRQIRAEELEAAYSLMQQGRNPSEAVYRMAQRVYGYTPKTAAPPAPAAKPAAPATTPAGLPTATLGPSGTAPDANDLEEMGRDDGDELAGTIGQALKERFQRK